MTVQATEAPSSIRGTGKGRALTNTYRKLEEIAAQAEADGFGKKWYVVGRWDKAATAGTVARGITHSNTARERPGNQKTPAGFWLAGVERLDDDSGEVRCQFFGHVMPKSHPCFDRSDSENPFD